MTSYVTPKKNTAFRFFVDLIDQTNTNLFKVNPTIAAGDFKVSIDGAAYANLATLPVVTPAAGRSVQIDCSTSEMNGDNIIVQCVDAAGAEWCDLAINIQTTANQIDDLSTAVAVSNLSSAQLFGFTNVATSAALNNLSSAQLSGFATTQTAISNLSSAQLTGFASAATSAALANLSSAQITGFATTLLAISNLSSAQLFGFATTQTGVTSVLTQAVLARQGAINRRETNPATGLQTLYADDGVTPLKTGNTYLDVAGSTLYDGTGAINRQNALT